MLVTSRELRGFSIVVRDDSAELLFPLNFTFGRGCEINVENLVADFLALMGAGKVVMQQPLSVNVFKVINTQADKVVEALCLYGRNIVFGVSVRLRGVRRRFYNLCTRTLPKSIKSRCELRITITNQMARVDSNIIQPHCRISRLLKYPFFIGMKCGRTHENASTSKVNKHQHIGVHPSSPSKDGLGEKVGGDQCVDVGADKLLPIARLMSPLLVRDRVMSSSFQNITDRRDPNFNAQLLKLSMQLFISPREVVGCKLQNQIHSCLCRSRAARFSVLGFLRLQPTAIGFRLYDQHHVGDVMVKQFAKPSQFCSFFWACINSFIIDPRPQHFNLIGQQLKPSIVSWTELLRQEHRKYLENTQIIAHLSQYPANQNHLVTSLLTRLICFRTPRENKESENLPKWGISSYPKARNCRKKWAEFFIIKLGFSEGLSLQRISGLPDWITNFLRKSSHCHPTRYR